MNLLSSWVPSPTVRVRKTGDRVAPDILISCHFAAGNVALVALLKANLAIMLLASMSVVLPLVESTKDGNQALTRYTNSKCLPSLSRTLRNHTIALGDYVWGHLWGVGIEPPVDAFKRPEATSAEKAADNMVIDAHHDAQEDVPDTLEDLQAQATEVLTGLYQASVCTTPTRLFNV